MTTTPFTDPLGRRRGDIVTTKGSGTEWRIVAIREDPVAPGKVQYEVQRTDIIAIAEWIDAQHFETP